MVFVCRVASFLSSCKLSVAQYLFPLHPMLRSFLKEYGVSILSISALGVAGTACRIILSNFTTNQHWFPQYSTCAVNLIGCLVIGMCVGYAPLKTAAPDVFRGLTIGFCGCLTTFSEWIVNTMDNENEVVSIISGIGLPLAAYLVGRDLTRWITWGKDAKKKFETNQLICIILFFACVITLGVIGGIHGGTHGGVSTGDIIACALSPIGALTRWTLAILLNERWDNKIFAFGVYAANIMAVILAGSLTKYRHNSEWAHYVIVGICGTLSTVSGWMADSVYIYEKNSKLGAYMYCLGTVATGILVMIPFIS